MRNYFIAQIITKRNNTPQYIQHSGLTNDINKAKVFAHKSSVINSIRARYPNSKKFLVEASIIPLQITPLHFEKKVVFPPETDS